MNTGILCGFNELMRLQGGHHWTSLVKKGRKTREYWQQTGNIARRHWPRHWQRPVAPANWCGIRKL